MNNPAPDFFISYSHADTSWMEWIRWQLESKGYSVNCDKQDFLPGGELGELVVTAVKCSKHVLCLISVPYLQGHWTKLERGQAVLEGKCIPVLISDDAPHADTAYREPLYIDLRTEREKDAFNRLMALQNFGASKQPPHPPSRPKPPFPGQALGKGSGVASGFSHKIDSELIKAPELSKCQRVKVQGIDCPSFQNVALVYQLGGGTFPVFLGVNMRNLEELVIKVLPLDKRALQPALKERLQREIALADLIKSRHIVRATHFDKDVASDAYWLAVEFVHGVTAESWLHRTKDAQSREREAVSILLAASKGLATIHDTGYVHRNLKPAHIMIPWTVNETAGKLRCDLAKLVDLGWTASHSEQEEPRPSNFRGTSAYLAPEQIRDRDHVAKASDIFAMGIILWEMISQSPPFGTHDPGNDDSRAYDSAHPKLRPSKEVDDVLRKCLAKRPEERFDDGHALLEELQTCLSSLGEYGEDSTAHCEAQI